MGEGEVEEDEGLLQDLEAFFAWRGLGISLGAISVGILGIGIPGALLCRYSRGLPLCPCLSSAPMPPSPPDLPPSRALPMPPTEGYEEMSLSPTYATLLVPSRS